VTIWWRLEKAIYGSTGTKSICASAWESLLAAGLAADMLGRAWQNNQLCTSAKWFASVRKLIAKIARRVLKEVTNSD
jgi:hypothetical protein